MLTVAWISAFPPDRNGGGGQIRQAQLLSGLASRAQVHLICPGPISDPVVRATVAKLTEVADPAGWRNSHPWLRRAADLTATFFSDRPIEVRAFGPVRQALQSAVNDLAVDLVLVDFAGLAPLLPKRHDAPWILTFHNLPSRMAAHQAATVTGRRRWLLERDASTAGAFERRAAANFDAVITCTAADAAALTGGPAARSARRRRPARPARARRAARPNAARVTVVPNGTDINRLRPSPVPAGTKLVFTGALYTNPNVDGAIWFCREILPLVRKIEPAAEIDVVGARPEPSVRALAGLPGVSVFPDVGDIAPFLRAARLAVVPLRIGSGSRLKALEAMAAGRPVIGTTIGLEGLDLKADEEALVADDPVAFARAIVRVLRDDQLAASLAMAGRAVVEQRFAWPGIAADFAATVLEVLRRHTAAAPGPGGTGQ